MPVFPPITVRRPQRNDLVDDPFRVCGVGTGFESVITARVRDGNGTQLVQPSISAGGTGVWGNFHAALALSGVPPTVAGTLEVFEMPAKGDGSELNKVVVSVVFGAAIVNPYHGFAQYTVKSGDSLASLAQQFHGDGSLWPHVFDANRDQVSDANRVYPGQALRVPQ